MSQIHYQGLELHNIFKGGGIERCFHGVQKWKICIKWVDTFLALQKQSSQAIFRKTYFNPLSAKFIKWSNTLKQIVSKLPTICLSVFDHFSGLALKGLSYIHRKNELIDRRAIDFFIYPLKTLENFWFSDVFSGY